MCVCLRATVDVGNTFEPSSRCSSTRSSVAGPRPHFPAGNARVGRKASSASVGLTARPVRLDRTPGEGKGILYLVL